MPNLKEQFIAHPVATISAAVGLISSIIGIVVFGGKVIDYAGEFIVTDAELVSSETSIIAKIHSEAVLTRSVFILDLKSRKTKLTEKLDETDSAGRISQILQEVKVLDERIKKLKGE